MSREFLLTLKSGICVLFMFGGTAASFAQESTGPLFSTPAGRSTTGTAPILVKPQGNGQILDPVGGRVKARVPSAPAQKVEPERQAASAATKDSAKTFGDWNLQCVDPAEGDERCQIVGSVLSADGKQVILVMSLARTPDLKATAIQMAVPLGVSLQAGVKIDLQDAYTGSMPLSRCTPQGCLVEGTVPEKMIEAMKAKAAASIEVATPDGKTVPISLPLKGFSDAYAAMIERG